MTYPTWTRCPHCGHLARRHDAFGCAAHRTCTCPYYGQALAHVLAGLPATTPTPPPRPTVKLAPKRLECLRLAAAGHGNDAIADALHLSVDTVKSHLRHTYRILGAHDRAHAVAIGYDLGFLDVGASSGATAKPAGVAS